MSKYIRFLVTLFLGIFGIHKFIDGKIGLGVLYLFTGGLFGIGWVVDLIKATVSLFKNAPTNNNKKNLLEWQKLIVVNSPNKLIMTEQELRSATQRQVNNDYRIIKDCQEIITNTVKPDIFFSRLDLLKEHLSFLAKLEPYFYFQDLPSISLDDLLRTEQEIIYQFIIRYFNSVTAYAETLKTDKGKINQYKKFYDSLMHYQNRLNEQNIKYVEYKYRQSSHE